MTPYLDAGVLVPLPTAGSNTDRAAALVASSRLPPVVSDWARTEFVSAIARLVRTGEVPRDRGSGVFLLLDRRVIGEAVSAETTSADVAAAEAMIRRLDPSIRTPEALHVAIAARLGSTLVTSDTKLAEAARTTGVPVPT